MAIDSATWTNCFADITSAGHGRVAQSFIKDVVTPSLTALREEVAKWQNSTEGGAPFIADDAAFLLKTTLESYCLSVQSLWERQIRGYLVSCAGYLRNDENLADKIRKAKWDGIEEAFLDLRGVDLKQFDSYPMLDLLQLTGNACRHGDGKSAQILFERCPNWWPRWSRLSIDGDIPLPSPPTFSSVEIPEAALYQFAEAIVWFWDDAEYIYLNSLSSKHPSVLRTMEALRTRRLQRRLEQS